MRKLALLALAAGAALVPVAASAQTVVHTGPGMTTNSRTFVHGGMFPHRLQPGFFVPPMWFGPQFYVGNWQTYGFPAPARDQRWVRYYDDAYLVDRDGRIRDARHGLDWDQYGERWQVADGIPHYYGSGDFQPGPEDYAWVERNRGYAQAAAPPVPDYGPQGPPPMEGQQQSVTTTCHAGPYRCGGAAAHSGYGYGYGVVAYPIVIETTVVSGGGCGCACECGYEEVVEEVVEYSRPVHRPRPVRRQVHRPRPVRPAPPPPGERG